MRLWAVHNKRYEMPKLPACACHKAKIISPPQTGTILIGYIYGISKIINTA